MKFDARYANLNNAQRQAVDTIDGPVMVIAGPGTGKTELLSMRVANILRKTDTLPENILCLTYTESGVVAMRERLISIIGQDAYRVNIHTFHSFGSETISQHRDYFYRGAAFKPADEISTYEILQSILKELPLSDPLASQMNGEFTFQSDIRSSLGELKKAGLSSGELLHVLDANDLTIEMGEAILAPIFDATINKKMIEPLQQAITNLYAIPRDESKFEIPALVGIITDSLQTAVDSALDANSTKPLTAWKARFLERNKDKKIVFKARERQRKLRSVAFVYERYMTEMEKAELFDYDDMILQVVHAIEVTDELRFNLQEKYQYLLVDEFQDTNLAQMRILHSLTNNPVNEDRPNIFIVGDDDQAIYSFQGADLSNILSFKEIYPRTEQIVLTENYRSIDAVLGASRSVIMLGAERLETMQENLSKQLHANLPGEGSVQLVELDSVNGEYQWIAGTIRASIDNGTNPSSIAILTRRHSDIQHLLPYLAHQSIAVSYERRDNVLELEPIRLLEQIGRIIVDLSNSRHDHANAQLAKLLTHPAWGFSSQDIWKLSTNAYDARTRWLDAMEAMPAFTDFRTWLIDLAADSSFTPLETMLDRLIGPADTAKDDTQSDALYSYFFAPEKLAENPTEYLTFLEGLRVIRTKLTEYHPREQLTLQSFIEFIELHNRIGDRIQISQNFGEGSAAIHVMTAHAAKGLEFEHVYVIGATDNVWGHKARARSRRINYPDNLALAPAGDSYDERLRLFYVAMTRAKRQLTITYSSLDSNNKPALPASFLVGESWQPTIIHSSSDIQQLTETTEIAWYKPLLEPVKDLHQLLQPQLDKYRLSATHLNTFVDVSSGGPQGFLVNRLLRFPSAPSVHAAYGTAVHQTLQQVHTHFNISGSLKPVEDILKDFETNLIQHRMDPAEFEAYLQKGSSELTAYINAQAETFSINQKPEFNFSHQQSMVGEACLTGSLDLAYVDASEKTMIVSDYKTGKPARSWQGSTEYEKIKLYKYRQQLLFYKLLVEGSRDYSNYTVTKGQLEFIEPTGSNETIILETSFDQDELERFKLLLTKVWEHITTFNLPDTSGYDATLKGILAFEQDLIDGNV